MDDLEERVFGTLPDETWVYPGHGDDTILGKERGSIPGWRGPRLVAAAYCDLATRRGRHDHRMWYTSCKYEAPAPQAAIMAPFAPNNDLPMPMLSTVEVTRYSGGPGKRTRRQTSAR